MSVYAKINQVISELGAIQKDGNNSFQGYRYISAESFLAAVRVPMSKHGLVVTTSLIDIQCIETIYLVRFQFTLVDIDDPDNVVTEYWMHSIPIEAKGKQGNYLDDKAIGKAATYAHRYFLMKLFLVTDQADELDAVNSPEQYAVDNTQNLKQELWNRIKSDVDINRVYNHENHIKNALKSYEGDVVVDGFETVKTWLIERKSDYLG